MTNKLPEAGKRYRSLKAEIKPETQSHISELSPEVKEAMETLKEVIKNSGKFDPFFVISKFKEKSNDLLNALDKQFKVSEVTGAVGAKKEDR